MKAEIERVAGSENVLDDPETLARYSKDHSLSPSRRPDFVVRPKSTEEVQEIVRIANKTRTPVIPASSGAHLYGGAIPDHGGVVVDLGRMDKILQVDERNRMVRVEPGVTYGRLQEELAGEGHRALIPLLPFSSKSVVTSHLEREPMLISKSEYSGESIYTMEVVLPTGELFRTGSAAAPGGADSEADLVGYSGPGTMDWHRFFMGAQGTMGIVTWMATKAEYLPTHNKLYFIPFDGIEGAVEALYGIQRQLLGYECFLLNSQNLASILADSWPEEIEELREKLPSWTVILRISGMRRFPEERIGYEEKDLMDVAQKQGFEPVLFLEGADGREKKIGEYLSKAWADDPYWKMRLRGRWADIFFLTTLNRAGEFSAIVNEAASSWKYPIGDIGVYIQPIEYGRKCHCEYTFPYAAEAKEGEKIGKMYGEMSEALIMKGAFFSRPYGCWAEMVYRRDGSYANTLREAKRIFDPENIMNPGKLCF